MRKIILIISFILCLFCSNVVAGVEESLASFKNKNNLYACKTDLDCEYVTTSCCSGADSISIKYLKKYNEIISVSCRQMACPAVVTRFFRDIPKCVENNCKLVRVDFSKKMDVDCSDVIRKDEQSFCFFDHAIAGSDFKQCANIEVEHLKSDCFWSIFESGIKNEQICKMIGKNFGQYDEIRCLQGLVKQTGDFKYCRQIKSTEPLYEVQQRSICYQATIPLIKEVESCNEFSSHEIGDPNIGYLFGECIKTVALKNKDAKLCNRIPDGEPFYSYWFYCLIEVAQTTKDKSVCDDIDKRTRPSNYPVVFSSAGCVKRLTSGSF